VVFIIQTENSPGQPTGADQSVKANWWLPLKRPLNPPFCLMLLFLGVVGSVPLSQAVVEACRGERPQALEIFHSKPTARNLRAYERNLEDSSWAVGKFRPWALYAQFAWFKDGGEKALLGRDG